MSLLSLIDLEFAVGGPPLLDGVNLALEPGERVAVVGRNGAGKTTLLKLIDGSLTPDAGEVRVQSGVRIARLRQEVPDELPGTIADVVAAGLGEVHGWIREFDALAERGGDPDRLAALQARIDAADGWNADQRTAQVLERLDLDGSSAFETLSGGLKRRVLLGRALVARPDVLLLDEPTNHLDIAAIEWLETLLAGYPGALVFITHDRRFLRALATRIVEIDRGRLTSWPGDWDNYLRRREERLHAEALADREFDRRLAEEETWIRQGIKARRTRNEGRVRALKRMRAERAARREQLGQVRMDVAEAEKSGRKVIELEEVSFGYGGETLIEGVSTTIFRGDRIGLIGPNGSGKSTLLKLMLGELQPSSGEVRLGTRLEVVYFDQQRAALRDDWSAAENVGDGRDFVTINGRDRHVIGYLGDFLFSPDRARAPISRLSGGERNRLLLAKLFARPSNLLVMDEPTNDLDAETLELLEALLAEYPGTLLLVSHDRDFLDNVVTATLVMEEGGRVGEYVGGYSDWQRQVRPRETPVAGPARVGSTAPGTAPPPAAARSKKLGYKQQRELDALPGKVEALEARMAELTARLNDPALYQESAEAIREVNEAVAALQLEIDAAYAAWEALEARAG
ncbi:ATP-binding cassette domain-containing protein [Wenzhouxiangella sp. XN79A]|uniref:ATP-binding cassette domain-containing protein n=1 Tax=Wenzhouxiangella sp. XN79A TaxID=2724193 RepID=UPI00144A94A2|nr:ATP-binding cassette domain-containing protein [Wenzhouxiangella sp. XN79A]NKI34699.1 ATP-binding cassette domain-containing protein [Wenzhouxiangella sp. XN79A]